jgi:molybdenum cofactor biosynthesis protein B
MSAYEEHQRAAEQIVARCAILTLSDTRDESSDKSGARIRDLLTAGAHAVAHYEVLRDEAELLRARLASLLVRDDVDVILTNGGTGISRRDATVPVIESVIASPLPGFGELFRMLSWEQVGSGAMLSRAIGGTTSGGKVVFAMPGSTKAVELAMTKLILPEIRHILRELRK